jgi:hypothetical protein
VDRERITDALRFWEILRIPYNLVLVAIALATAGIAKLMVLPVDLWLWLAFFAVIANVLYCAAYPVDLFVQMSDWRILWRRWRWVLWMVGTLTAGWLAYNFASGIVMQ